MARGEWTIELVEHASQLTAVDRPPEMLALTRNRLAWIDQLLAVGVGETPGVTSPGYWDQSAVVIPCGQSSNGDRWDAAPDTVGAQ